MQPVSSANFRHLLITSCSHEKDTRLCAFPYCKWRKGGRSLGRRLFESPL